MFTFLIAQAVNQHEKNSKWLASDDIRHVKLSQRVQSAMGMTGKALKQEWVVWDNVIHDGGVCFTEAYKFIWLNIGTY